MGVCRLAVVPVRLGPEEHAPQVTQLLFGDHYEMLQVDDKRNRIYIRRAQWMAPKVGLMRANIMALHKIILNRSTSPILRSPPILLAEYFIRKVPLTILLGSIVPISNSELFKMEEQFAFNGESKSLGQKREFEFVKSIAQKYLNAPEVPGGKKSIWY
jgi:hypothetical protein